MVDPFSLKRLKKFVEEFRARTGQYATQRDLESANFDGETLKAALKKKVVQELYVTMTSGAVVKVFKASEDQ